MTNAMAPAFAVRPANGDDALCLSVLAMQVFLDTYATQGVRPALAREVLSEYSEAGFARAIACEDTRVSVAESDGHLIGFVQLVVGRAHVRVAATAPSELSRLYVQQPFLGKQVGVRLLGEAERLARAAGSDVLWLTHWVHNHRAQAFYARRGYVDLGPTSFTFEGETHDNRVCAKRLASVTAGAAPPDARCP